ncbi:MAG: hypothetical protein KGJ84_11310 [Elusimicrobia bacterium]|nr:hypothetical protein [Elusimicrobiota bacterium]
MIPKMTTRAAFALSLIFAAGAAAADDPDWGDNPAGYLGDQANFVNGVMFVGWSPQDHPNGGQGTPKYDLYNYLVLNHVDPNDRNWAPAAAEELNKTHPCKYWAEDGESIDYEDEYAHSDVPGHGAPGGAIPGAVGQFTWGGRDGYVKPGNPCGGPSGQVNPPAGGGAGKDPSLPALPTLPPSGDVTKMDLINLADVKFVNSPDVRSWPITSNISDVSFPKGQIHVDHTKLGKWPPVVIASDGTTQEATIWIFFKIHGQWYGAGGERLRPKQTTKELSAPSAIGPGWFYSNSWAPMAGYVPQPGETVGWMITAGSERADNREKVKERTAVIIQPFPADPR